MAGVDLRHILLDLLPSSDMTKRCRELRLHHHLEKIIPDLWAINAVIWDATMRAGTLPDVEMWMADEGAAIRDAMNRAGRQPDVEMWMADAGAAIADVQNLLDRILEWPGRAAAPSNPLLRSFLGIRVAFRLYILQELKEMGVRLKELVRRGTDLDLRKEMMDAMDPCDEEYTYVLGDEVVGRDEDRDNIVEILQRKHSSSNGEPFVFGIGDDDDEDRDNIVEILQRKHSSSNGEPFDDDDDEDQWKHSSSNGEPFVIAICDEGFVGSWSSMGKTTVARMIYHHPWVRQHFHHRIWVDVSIDLYSDPVSIGREFARCITGESCDHLQSHQALWLLVNERLGQGRYLLILNDVHLDGVEGLKGKWDELKHKLLHVGGIGSTVIITTTYWWPKYIFGCKDYVLDGLTEDGWIKLVMRDTFSGSAHDKENTRTINFLLQFAEQQYQTLDGSPLVAKTLGSIFRYTEVSRWQQVADALSSHSDASSFYFHVRRHQHFQLMRLQNLSTKFARIALYSSLCNLRWSRYLKEDYMHMMIAEDLLRAQSLDAEDMYRLVIKLDLDFATTYYYLRIRIGQDSIGIPEQCCHLCLLLGDASTFPTALSAGGKKRLRTLILQTKDEMVEKGQKCQIREIPAAMFTNLVHLRILHLSYCRIQWLPNTIAKLVSLRYLKLSYTEIQALPKHLSDLQNLKILKLAHCEEFRKLPESIHKLKKLLILKLAYCQKLQMLPESIIALTNLQELDIEGCQWLVKLPEGLDSMKNLTMLNVDKCVSLTRLSHGIGRLTNLLKLSMHTTADSIASVILESQSLANFKELCLKKLDGLTSVKDARALKLKDKIFLERLVLCWEWRDMNAAISHDKQLLEDLQPNLTLKKLEIVSYTGKKLPSWLACKEGYLKYLTEIKLVNLKKCERLPPLGHLPRLETVEISGMESISAVDDAFYGDGDGDGDTFPSLKTLIFSEMPTLERWLKAKGEGAMFRELRRLMLIQCPKFKELQVRPSTTLRLKLSVWLNDGKLLSSEFVGWQKLEGVEELEISGCEELRCFPPGLKHLKHLSDLRIMGCNNLMALPDWLAQLKSLRSLSVQDCAMLRCLPPGLESLEWLEIVRCNNLMALPDWLAQLKSLGLLILRDCAMLRSLPPGLKHLSQLTIMGCNNLIALPDWLAELKSLENLVVLDCARLSFIPERLKQSPHIRMWIEGCPRLQL